MQKIIKQNFEGLSLEDAGKQAEYTWQKDEIAFYFCYIYCDVFKVRFTGKHWLIQNGRFSNPEKIYQYEYLDGSDPSNYHLQTPNPEEKISHGKEDVFFTTKEECISKGLGYIKYIKKDALKKFKTDLAKLTTYSDQQL
ncbi:MAG: hypothetical protein WCG25_05930 [bacterium]